MSGVRPTRRVTFPQDDSQLVTGYLEPLNPWQHKDEVTCEELVEHYVESCKKHNTPPIPHLIEQLQTNELDGSGERRKLLSLQRVHLSPAACESLEAILRRARFTRLDLRETNLTDETAVALFDMLEYYESAKEVVISGNKDFGILGWQACSRMINKSQWLEQLEAQETSLSETTAPVLGRALRPACTLRVLHLQRSKLSGRALLCLTSALKQNTSVKELHLGDNELVTEDAKQLASMLQSNSILQLLDISNNNIKDAGIELIADALVCQPLYSPSSDSSTSDSSVSSPHSITPAPSPERGLAVLIVWNNNLTRNCGQHFSKALSKCRSLEVLNIGQNPLGGETINRLRSALQQNRTLLSLGVQSSRLGPEAAIAIAEVIEDNPVIQRIDLRDNKLQAGGLLALAKALRNNFTVTRIDLDDSPFTLNKSDQPLEEASLVEEIRSLCNRNENALQSPAGVEEANAHRRRLASFSSRKISLTCQTLHRPEYIPPEPTLSPPKGTSGRLRSPLPSPVPSPMSSPIPSPSHRSRFQVSRVSDSPVATSESPSPSTPPGPRNFFVGNSRFKVVTVQEPPSISVHAPEEPKEKSCQTEGPPSVKCTNSRFKIVRNVDISSSRATDDLNPEKVQTSTTPTEDHGDKAIEKIAAITEGLGNLIEEMKDLSKTTNLKRKNSDLKSQEVSSHAVSAIKKNRSESSLDSPDLEVSRLMQNQTKSAYDSNSSLDISGSSMESLNGKSPTSHPPPQNPTIFAFDPGDNEVFTTSEKMRTKLSTSSNESSLESSTFDMALPQLPEVQSNNTNLLHSSISSNESVSPNIFGKHMKLHGSVTSLEASVSSIDSFKTNNVYTSPRNNNTFSFLSEDRTGEVESSDSGIDSKLKNSSMNESISSNEGTITSNSHMRSNIFSFGNESSSVDSDSSRNTLTDSSMDMTPKRVSSLLDVPSMGASDKQPRTRKISWVPPTVNQQKKEADEQQSSKMASGFEKILSLFQQSTGLFSRSSSDSGDKRPAAVEECTLQRGESQTSVSGPSSGSFWSWTLGTSSSNKSSADQPKEAEFSTSSVSAEYTVRLKPTEMECDYSDPQSLHIEDDNSGEDNNSTNMMEELVTNNPPSLLSVQNVALVNNGKLGDRVLAHLDSNTSSLETLACPDTGPSVENLPNKVIKQIKENISPENTLTSSMTNTKALAQELMEKRENVLGSSMSDIIEVKSDELICQLFEGLSVDPQLQDTKICDELPLIETIDKTNIEEVDEGKDALLDLMQCEVKVDDKVTVPTEISCDENLPSEVHKENIEEVEAVPETAKIAEEFSELKNAVIQQAEIEVSNVISISEDLVEQLQSGDGITEHKQFLHEMKPVSILKKTKSSPQDIPKPYPHYSDTHPIPNKPKKSIPIRCGSLPENTSTSPKCLMDNLASSMSKCGKSRSPVNLGKLARDSLYALNMSEEEIEEMRESRRLPSLDSVKSLGSVSEDGGEGDSKSINIVGASQESLASLGSISESAVEND